MLGLMPRGNVSIGLALALVSIAPGCSGTKDSPPAARSVPSSAGSVAPTRVPEQDALWQLAEQGDALDLARLAQREGAVSLAREVESNPTRRRTALVALPHADDRELALRTLCRLLGGKVPYRLHLATTVVSILSYPPAARERFDVAGVASCRAPLEQLSKAESPALRDLGSSGLARLAEHTTQLSTPQ